MVTTWMSAAAPESSRAGSAAPVRQLPALARDGLLDRRDQRGDVGVAPGDHDAAHGAHAAEIGEAGLHVLGEANERDVADAHRGRSGGALAHRQRLELGERGLGHAVDRRRTAARKRGAHVGEGQAPLAQLARLDVDAHLAQIAAHRGDLGDPGIAASAGRRTSS